MEKFFQDLFYEYFNGSLTSLVWVLIIISAGLLTAIIRGQKRYKTIMDLLQELNQKIDVLFYQKDSELMIPNIFKSKRRKKNEENENDESLFE